MMVIDSEANIRESAPEPDPGLDAAPAPRPSRGFRFRLTTMLALVAAVAPVTSVYVAWAENNPDPDISITMVLTVVLTGLAVGTLRRASPIGVMAQIGLACAALRLSIEVVGTRPGNYTPLALFTATVVVPLLIVRALESSGREGRRRERVAAVAAVLLNTGLNLGAYVAFLVAENEIGMLPIPIPVPGLAIQASVPGRLSFTYTMPVYTGPMPPGPPPLTIPPDPPLPSIDPNAPPLMPGEGQPIPLEPGSNPLDNVRTLDMPSNIPAPASAPASKSK